MFDRMILDWLSDHSTCLEIRHNAHRDSHTTIARHLLHRERLGDSIIYAGRDGRRSCVEANSLWEISLRDLNDRVVHVAGPTLELCAQVTKATLDQATSRAIAA